jgi:dTDP-4-dehydrorhamnose 3,5-epimerase
MTPTGIDGLFVVQRKPLLDERGYLERLFCAREFASLGLQMSPCQMNHTFTRRKASVRGMHFQHPPHADAKLVSCLRGEVFDVAIDLRKGSQTLLQWHGEILSAQAHSSVYIPCGLAHGFQTLSDDCELLYLHSSSYEPEAEGALNAFDPGISIKWPLPVTDVSERDRNHPHLMPNFSGIEL